MKRILAIMLTSIATVAISWPLAINAQEAERFTLNTKQGNAFNVRFRAITGAGDDPFFYAEVGEPKPGYMINSTTVALWFEGVSGDGTIFIRLRNPAGLDDPRPRVDRVLRFRIGQDGTVRMAVGIFGGKEIEGKRGQREVLVFRGRLTNKDELQISLEPQAGQTITK